MAFGDADASTPAFVKASNAGNDVTTASFTPPAGALLIAFAWHDTAGGNVTNTSQVTDSQGLTWTRRATRSKQDDGAGAANSHIAISTAVVASSVAMTVTTTGTNCNDPAGLYVRVITGADTTTPMDATPVEGTTNAAVVSTSITTVTDGARCFLQIIDWNLAAVMTAGTGQTAIVSDTIGAPDDRIYLGVTDAVTSPAGSTTLSTASPSTGNTQNWIGIAVRPAAGTSLNAGNAAATVAANNVTLSASPAVGNATVAAAANAATLQAGIAAGSDAVTVGAFDATVTSGTMLSAGDAAATLAANAVGLAASMSLGGAAATLAASGSTLAVGLPAGFGAVTVGAFDVTLTGAAALAAESGAVAVGAFDVTLISSGQGGDAMAGSWQGLLDVLNEIRLVTAEERAAPLVACPHDGEPLQSARGVLHCRFCGRLYSGNQQL